MNIGRATVTEFLHEKSGVSAENGGSLLWAMMRHQVRRVFLADVRAQDSSFRNGKLEGGCLEERGRALILVDRGTIHLLSIFSSDALFNFFSNDIFLLISGYLLDIVYVH